MFQQASSFNGDISSWQLSNTPGQELTSLAYLFQYSGFNRDINDWDVSRIKSFRKMFQSATQFNQPLRSWDLTSAETIHATFDGATRCVCPLPSPHTHRPATQGQGQ